jgi:hypothetical protein
MERDKKQKMTVPLACQGLIPTGLLFLLVLCVSIPSLGLAQNSPRKKRSIRKVQEVNFSDMNLKGTLRNPDGAYLVQKRGIKFLPLYEVNKDMDARIRDSSFYVK